MLEQIQQIKCKFEEIANDRLALRLSEEDGPRRSNNETRAPTSHLIDESGIFGREREKEELISLLSSEYCDGKVVSVVTIVGTGGLGKTTLAQLVYKDLKSQNIFDGYGWVCVSEDFNVERLTREMLESIAQRLCNFANLGALQEEIIKVIRERTILLVLDDVWNEKRNYWESFKVPFMLAASVKILVTTRSKLVAEVMQTDQTFKLCCLSKEQCWPLFRNYAHNDGVNQHVGSYFKEIGMQIVKKCGMLPLAVKSIASLLRQEPDEESWRVILESELWETNVSDEIFLPLQLSYAHLPTYLKPCLILCSMFPKDYVYDTQKLVQLWVSQGYIEPKGKKSVENIGLEYSKQLWDRSFFEDPFNENTTLSRTFKLHDLVHDLARHNSKNGCLSIEAGWSSKLPVFSNKLYHLCIDFSKKTIEPMQFEIFTSLRTLIILDLGVENLISTPDVSLPQKLRVLEIDRFVNPEFEFISSVGTLKHVRYLSLGDLPFERLPESICSLYNLRNLKLQNCAFHELPKSIANLISLGTLEIACCDFLEWLPESLCELKALRYLKIYWCEQLGKLPTGIGNLVSLETLRISRCDCLEWLPELFCQLKTLKNLILCCHALKELPSDMGSLTNLQSLWINCEGIRSLPPSMEKIGGIESLHVELQLEKIGWLRDFDELGRSLYFRSLSHFTDVQCANLMSMHKLESLNFSWKDSGDDEDDGDVYEICLDIKKGQEISLEDQNDSAVMAALQPHHNLRILKFYDYGGSTFPEWIGNPSSCASLERLNLVYCNNLRFLPFGSLCKLKYLDIFACDTLQIITAESLPPELEELHIGCCEELISVPGIHMLKSLVKCSIRYCDNLQFLVMDTEPSPELLMTKNESSYQNSLFGSRNLTSLRSLKIKRCPKLQLPKLQLLSDELLYVDSCEVVVIGCPAD